MLSLFLGTGVTFATTGNAFAGGEEDAGPDCSGADRCSDACNSPPDTQPAVRYPLASEPLEVLCPTVILEGAHDPDSLVNGLTYRLVIDVAEENPPQEPYFYDSGLITAQQPTTSFTIAPPVETLRRGGAYWMRVWVNDSCSDPVNDIFVQGPPTQVYFEVSRNATNNCSVPEPPIDGGPEGDGGPSGGGSAGCCSTAGEGPDGGSLAVLPLAALALAATRRRNSRGERKPLPPEPPLA